MTVSSTTTKNSYSGDGSTTTFAYAFKIFADADLTVILRSAAGTETVQTLTTNYTVTNAGNASGGNVEFVTAPASGVTVVIRRNMAQTQSTDYVANDPFPAATHEDALDRLTFIAQQQQEEVDRSIKLSRTNTMTSTEFTVGATDRANKVLAFDGNGELSVTQELGTYKGTDATVTTEAYVVRDIIKSTTAAQLNNVYICVADAVAGDLLTDTDHFELLIDAVTAATSATNAANSASAAATSESNAATSESNAATSASNAATSESNASTSETNAATSATSASNSATSAASSATTATTKASEASTSATNAATSESNASTSATNAATSATNASTSETNAATSATTATTQASAASTSASNAATSASNASTSEINAAASAAAAAASADTFDDTYLGSKSSDPSVDNDGDALNAGDLYFNTTSNTLKVYTGSAWQDAAIDSSGFVQTTGDTMTGNLLLPNGAVGTPAISFSSDTNTGIYRGGTDILKFVTAGTDAITINASQDVTLAGTIQGGLNEPIDIRDGLGDVSLRLISTSSNANAGAIRVDPDNTSSVASTLEIQIDGTTKVAKFSSGGDISFYEDTGTTPKLFWDASEEGLSLGTTDNPNGSPLYIRCATDDNIRIQQETHASIQAVNNSASAFTELKLDGSSLLLNSQSSGNVGIGTSSPTGKFQVDGGRSYFSANSDAFALYLRYNTSTAGVFVGSPSTDTFTVSRSGGQEHLRIDSSGNVGIGTSSPSQKLDVNGTIVASTTASQGARIERNGTTGGANFDSVLSTGHLHFRTGTTEHVQINDTGMVMINGVNEVARLVISQNTQALNMCFLQNTNATFGGNYFSFANSSGVSTGTINQNGSTTVAYNTSSDYRLKENINYDFDATSRLKQLKPARFNWIEDETNTLVDGFIAHEVSSIVPEAITGEKDATKDVPNVVLHADGTVKAQGISEEDWIQGKSDGIYANDTTWVASKTIIDAQGIDQSKLVPLLVKTIQELEARITALENGE